MLQLNTNNKGVLKSCIFHLTLQFLAPFGSSEIEMDSVDEWNNHKTKCFTFWFLSGQITVLGYFLPMPDKFFVLEFLTI